MNKNTQKTLKSIEKLGLPELQARFAEIVGEASRSPNRNYAERADMRSRWLLLHVLRRERTRAAPHIPNVFGGRTTLRFPRPEACMATGAASWRSQGERT